MGDISKHTCARWRAHAILFRESEAGLKTRRDKVAPQALLAPRRESLADLAIRVMTIIYGPHAETALMHRLMHQTTAGSTGWHAVGDDAGGCRTC